MLITVNRIETVSCDHNGQETHRWTFQVFQYYSKRTAKIKLPRRKNVKALVLFEMSERSERYKNPSKTSFRKAEKATVSIMFGKLTLVCFGSWTCGTFGPKVHGSHYFQQPMRGNNFICIWITYKKNHWICNRAGIAELAKALSRQLIGKQRGKQTGVGTPARWRAGGG